LAPLLLGFLLGMRHALDADHVVAVTAILSRERSLSKAARVGAWWGVGHSATILLVGGSIVVFRLAIVPRVALAFEFVVALMLIVLGILNLARAREESPAPTLPPLVIGIVHGLAGTAAIALLVLAAIPAPLDGIIYLMVFGAGTILGMIVVTAAIAAPTLAATRHVVALRRAVRVGAGALSLVLGVWLARDIGIDRGLFGATPVWAAE
jgi:high-affinity nickel-transport protein